MKLTNEQIEMIKACTNVQELMDTLKTLDLAVTEEQAAKLLDALQKQNEVSDDELEKVAGGEFLEDLGRETFNILASITMTILLCP